MCIPRPGKSSTDAEDTGADVAGTTGSAGPLKLGHGKLGRRRGDLHKSFGSLSFLDQSIDSPSLRNDREG